jgi:hypothetical protein
MSAVARWRSASSATGRHFVTPPNLESLFDGQKVSRLAVVGMPFNSGASPCQSAAARGTSCIFRKNLRQCVGELTIEGGNLSAVGHGLRYQLSRRCKRLSLLHDVGDKNSSLCLTGLATCMGRLWRYLESIARFDCSGRLALDR